ncbi:MAG: CrcB family protein [Aeriscardovia sp.]|nr:CrcB family protein [Aeriscardovia sp.]
MWVSILVIVTSALGTALRFCQDRLICRLKGNTAMSIFAASLIACLVCGILNALLTLVEISPLLLEIVCAGFLCGYSSFAVISTVTALLARPKGGWKKSLFYSFSSFILSLCFYFIGFFGVLILH